MLSLKISNSYYYVNNSTGNKYKHCLDVVLPFLRTYLLPESYKQLNNIMQIWNLTFFFVWVYLNFISLELRKHG